MSEADLIQIRTTPNTRNNYNCVTQNSVCYWTSELGKGKKELNMVR